VALNLRAVRDEAEKHAVIRALARANGNIVKAAEMLGVSRPTLYDLLERFGLRQANSGGSREQRERTE
jgi:two-component system NtrC family response regulator